MARPVRFRREAQSKFSNLFTGLCQRKSSWEVWADFVSMAAISISNAFDREGKTRDGREKQYLRTINGYNQAEQEVWLMPALYGEVWAARIQWERVKLALDDIGVMRTGPEAPRQAQPEQAQPIAEEPAQAPQLTLF